MSGLILVETAQFYNVLRFGADLKGNRDSTAAFQKLANFMASKGGGIGHVPTGQYMVSDLVIDHESIMFVGETSGYGYAATNGSVVMFPGPNALFVARMKGSREGVPINAAAYSGFKNIQFMQHVGSTCEYGVFIDSGATIMEQVTVQGFDYGGMCADQMNANRFKNCAFILNRYCNLAVSDVASNSFVNPGVTDITSVTNTTFTVEGCQFRQGGWGVVMRSGVNVKIVGCGFESTKQSGMYLLRMDTSSLRMINVESSWFENCYDAYDPASPDNGVQGNRMFLTAPGTYIPWTVEEQGGCDLVINSQTRHGGGGDMFDFKQCAFITNGAQRGPRLLSGFKTKFEKCWFNGDNAEPEADPDAEAVQVLDALKGNDPSAIMQSIVDNHGAKLGGSGAYFRTTTSFNAGRAPGLHAEVGVFGGPHQFWTVAADDPRRADPRTVCDVYRGSWTANLRAGASSPFTVNSQTCTEERIGPMVHVQGMGVITAVNGFGGDDAFYMAGGLTYAAAQAGFMVGFVRLLPLNSSPAPLFGGKSELIMNTTATMITVDKLLPAMTPGSSYQFYFDAWYVPTP
jgi:hypothetical protein